MILLAAFVFFLSCRQSSAAVPAADLFKELAPKVVLVETRDRYDRAFAQGSGVLVGPSHSQKAKFPGDYDSSDSFSRRIVNEIRLSDWFAKEFWLSLERDPDGSDILTNFHVVCWARRILITTKNGQRLPASVVYCDAERDLAILRVAGKLAPAELSASTTIGVGQKVYAIGAPRGLSWSLSDGIVSAIRKTDSGQVLVQTTVPISPGSSGGGLFDETGALVGLTSSQVTEAQNLNFAIRFDQELAKEMQEARRGASVKPSIIAEPIWTVGVWRIPISPQGEASLRWLDSHRQWQQWFALEKAVDFARTGSPNWEASVPEEGAARRAAMRHADALKWRVFPRDLWGWVSALDLVKTPEAKANIVKLLPAGAAGEGDVQVKMIGLLIQQGDTKAASRRLLDFVASLPNKSDNHNVNNLSPTPIEIKLLDGVPGGGSGEDIFFSIHLPDAWRQSVALLRQKGYSMDDP